MKTQHSSATRARFVACLTLLAGFTLASPLVARPHDGHDHAHARPELPARTWTLIDGTQLVKKN